MNETFLHVILFFVMEKQALDIPKPLLPRPGDGGDVSGDKTLTREEIRASIQRHRKLLDKLA